MFVAYALMNVIWSTLYLEHWKRESAEHAYRWGTLDKEDELLTEPRPLYTVSEMSLFYTFVNLIRVLCKYISYACTIMINEFKEIYKSSAVQLINYTIRPVLPLGQN